jgi:hypothetical protein
MQGRRNLQITMLAFIDLEERVSPDHSPRAVTRLAHAERVFGRRRPSVPRSTSGRLLVRGGGLL